MRFYQKPLFVVGLNSTTTRLFHCAVAVVCSFYAVLVAPFFFFAVNIDVLYCGAWFLNGQVIPAFEEAVSGMSLGGIRRCCICLLQIASVIFREID